MLLVRCQKSRELLDFDKNLTFSVKEVFGKLKSRLGYDFGYKYIAHDIQGTKRYTGLRYLIVVAATSSVALLLATDLKMPDRMQWSSLPKSIAHIVN
ncbi:hypothetical protein E2C01_029949 [Portunus trituberculatus]|uniref:Uncharacterized protein n=1 Tax=Portunus trituberculatus TaxID=210409 RepID=A0A5B7ETE4_PORTR|nr:hypothetical protein [Portunus trituberculatus]